MPPNMTKKQELEYLCGGWRTFARATNEPQHWMQYHKLMSELWELKWKERAAKWRGQAEKSKSRRSHSKR
jgi:iron-sulfur cluster repair protein YtfE (RIC family)